MKILLNKMLFVILVIFLVPLSSCKKTIREYYDQEERILFCEFKVNNKGKKDGKYLEYWENGNKNIECTYKNDTLIGDFYYYYESGKIKYHVKYLNGLMWSILLYQSEEGGKFDFGDFDDGNGTVFVYSKNKKHPLYEKYTYTKGLIEGYNYIYSPDGRIIDSILYINGKRNGKGAIDFLPPF